MEWLYEVRNNSHYDISNFLITHERMKYASVWVNAISLRFKFIQFKRFTHWMWMISKLVLISTCKWSFQTNTTELSVQLVYSMSYRTFLIVPWLFRSIKWLYWYFIIKQGVFRLRNSFQVLQDITITISTGWGKCFGTTRLQSNQAWYKIKILVLSYIKLCNFMMYYLEL